MSIRFGRAGANAGLIATAAFALLFAVAGHAKEALPFCSPMSDVKDVKLREAASAVFGPNPAHRPKDDSTSACIFPAAALEYPDARVLITGTLPGGDVYPMTMARLSAYFLRPIGGAFRLVTVCRDFADGGSGMGSVGPITAIHYGGDEGIMVEGGATGQGYAYGWRDFYLFRKDGIVSLGMIRTSFDDGGAVEKERIAEIDGKVEIGQPQPDQVRVVYAIAYGGKMREQSVVWRSQGGKFIRVSGSVPKELEP